MFLASYPFVRKEVCQPMHVNRYDPTNVPSRHEPTIEFIDLLPERPSFLREKYQLFYVDLMKRLHVDMTLLDYNYTRLMHYINELKQHKVRLFGFFPEEIEPLKEWEYPWALEFYLQFDMDLFFMKTCCYRQARPRSKDEGLFCRQAPAIGQYELADCGNCGLCYPRKSRHNQPRTSMVTFGKRHEYTSLNGYRVILNCPATCHTQNIVYVLQCLCRQHEYVGVTMYSLHDRLRQHRGHANRILHEFLLAEQNIQLNLVRPKSREIQRKDRMKLYRHLTQCPVAKQHFLDENPEYRQLSLTLNPDRLVSELDTDMYYASVLAVLPQPCSEAFRCLIESMFITHMNPSLNSMGNLLGSKELTRTDESK